MKFSLLAILVAFIGYVQLASAEQPNGAFCTQNSACMSAFCTAAGKCGLSPQTFGFPPGAECNIHDDCNSTVCTSGQCAKYIVGDGPCSSPDHCETGSCDFSTNSCSSGGGTKRPGEPCQSAGECASGMCYTDIQECQKFMDNQGQCMSHADCFSNYCNMNNFKCEISPSGGGTGGTGTGGNNNLLRPGETCESSSQCASGSCVSSGNSKTCDKLAFNQGSCTWDGDCVTNYCNSNQICIYQPPSPGNGTHCNPPLGANLVSQLHNLLKCSKDSDCEGLMYPVGTSDEMTDAWCWMGDNGGTCGPSPAKPPACIGQCAQACDGGSPAGQEIKDMCPCLTQCSISNCHSDADKKVITHLHRDLCGLADPYFFGGYDISCPKGMYVKGKGQAGKEFCAKCPAGTYSLLRSHKNKMCKRCPKGYIQPDEGMSKCYKCEEGKKSDKARIHCV